MAISAGYAYGFVFAELVNHADWQQTTQRIAAHMATFKFSIAVWGLIALLDVLVAIFLLRFFGETNRPLARIMAAFRIVYAIFLLVAITALMAIPAFVAQGDAASVAAAINGFQTAWSIGLVVFGLHLFALGRLAILAPNVPKSLGVLLIFAGICYAFIHATKVFMPAEMIRINLIERYLSPIMALGELAFAVWLLFRGGKKKEL